MFTHGPLSSLDAYADAGEDLFGIGYQFRSWLSCSAPQCQFDILLIRYESLNASLPALFDFLELPQYVREAFPPVSIKSLEGHKERVIRSDIRQKLKRIYGPIEAAVAKIPPQGLILRNEGKATWHSAL